MIQGIAAAGMGLMDFGSQIYAQEKGWSNQKAMMKWQEEMWNKQNEYNKPINQRARLEEGGFNPHLMYGTGSLANTAGSVGSPPTPNMKYVNMAQSAQRALEAYQTQTSVDLAKESMQLEKEKFQQQKYVDFFKMANINADTLTKGLSLESGSFDLNLKKKLEANNVQMSNNMLKDLELKLKQGKTNLDQQIDKFNYDKTLRPYETQSKKYQADITKSDAFMKFIEANNLPAIQRVRLQQMVREYTNAVESNHRANVDNLINKMRYLLERERLTKDEINNFFNLIKK